MQPYIQWVRARAQKLGMPYEAVLPVIVEHTDEEGGSLDGTPSIHAY